MKCRNVKILGWVVGATLALGVVGEVFAQDWDNNDLWVRHDEYQAVYSDGSSVYASSGGYPLLMRGVVLNNSEDWLDSTANSSLAGQAWKLGAESEIFVQTVDSSEYTWDDGDFGGTAVWMGQLYGNTKDPINPSYNYSDSEWYAELDRLHLYRPGTTQTNDELVRAGDLIEVYANTGRHYAGKMNINEDHNNSTACDFFIRIVEKNYGLPEAEEITLSNLITLDGEGTASFIFDETRQTGGERYQSTLVDVKRVRLADTTGWGTNSDLVLQDGNGRTMTVHLGLNESFTTAAAPTGYFDVTGILNQKAYSGQGGYYLCAMNADAFAHMAGDADEDWDVDNSDLGAAYGNFTNVGGSGKTWADGDFDGDGDVDNSDLGEAFGNFTGPVVAEATEQSTLMVQACGDDIGAIQSTATGTDLGNRADLIYNIVTGEVFLDQSEADGGIITNFVLQTDDADGFNTGVVNFPFYELYMTDETFEISQTDALVRGFVGGDIWNLGAILAAGLSQAELEAFFSKAMYVGAQGTGVQSFDLLTVPEPSTGALLLTLAALAFFGKRWITKRG